MPDGTALLPCVLRRTNQELQRSPFLGVSRPRTDGRAKVRVHARNEGDTCEESRFPQRTAGAFEPGKRDIMLKGGGFTGEAVLARGQRRQKLVNDVGKGAIPDLPHDGVAVGIGMQVIGERRAEVGIGHERRIHIDHHHVLAGARARLHEREDSGVVCLDPHVLPWTSIHRGLPRLPIAMTPTNRRNPPSRQRWTNLRCPRCRRRRIGNTTMQATRPHSSALGAWQAHSVMR
jgi:hypothetical protein